MLTNSSRHSPRSNFDEDTDFIHNYYERHVLQELINTSTRAQQDREFLADVACVALNRLPPRYIRHDVDMTFFMSPQEMQEIEDKVTHAVKAALSYVESRERGEDAESPTATKLTATEKKSTKKTSVKKPKANK
jgi:hypothetical protein